MNTYYRHISNIVLILSLILFSGCVTQSENEPDTIYCDGKLQIYRPQNPNGKALVILPGGGYSGYQLSSANYWTSILLDQGYTCAVLYYDLPNGVPEVSIKSVKQAFKELRDNSSNLKIEKGEIGIMGSSAGGHLSTMISYLMPIEERPAFQILMYPLISMESGVTHTSSRNFLLGANAGNDLIEAYSTEKMVDNDIPPTFIGVSLDDGVVPCRNSYLYADALKYCGCEIELYTTPSGTHGCEDQWMDTQQLKESVLNWLNNK